MELINLENKIPSFITHQVNINDELDHILGCECIEPKKLWFDVLHLSLDGAYSFVNKYYLVAFIFEFPPNFEIIPSIYLLPHGHARMKNYELESILFVYEAEVITKQMIKLSDCKCKIVIGEHERLDKDELKTLLEKINKYNIEIVDKIEQTDFNKEISKFTRIDYYLAGKEVVTIVRDYDTITESLIESIHNYNKWVCSLFSLDYKKILKDAKKHVEELDLSVTDEYLKFLNYRVD